MKRLLPIAAALILTSSASAESETFTITGKMTCDKNGTIIKLITSEYKEKPIIIGTGPDDIKVVLVANEKTKTWTIIAIKEDLTCILALGTDLTTLNNKNIKYNVAY